MTSTLKDVRNISDVIRKNEHLFDIVLSRFPEFLDSVDDDMSGASEEFSNFTIQNNGYSIMNVEDKNVLFVNILDCVGDTWLDTLKNTTDILYIKTIHYNLDGSVKQCGKFRGSFVSNSNFITSESNVSITSVLFEVTKV